MVFIFSFYFIGYCIADLGILTFRDRMLPNSAPPSRPKPPPPESFENSGTYNTITARNIFASSGIIPDALVDKERAKNKEKEADPVPSQLPLTLIGTLVHSNPAKSIAAIDIKR